MKTLTPARLAAMLKRIPERKFRIAGLAPQLLTPEGRVDIEQCMEHHGEILPAIEEVRNYIRDCHSAQYHLEHVSAAKFEEDWEDEDEIVEEEDGV